MSAVQASKLQPVHPSDSAERHSVAFCNMPAVELYLPPASPANEGTDVRLFNSFTLTRSSYEFVLRIQDNETFFYPKFEPIIDTHYKAVIVKSQEIILRSISNQWYIVNYKDFVSTDFLTT